MHYAGIDVLSIAPTHFQDDVENSVMSEDKSYCAICKEEVNVQDAKVCPQSKTDVVMLPCNHPYHYACLREACRYNKVNKSGRECALCRAPYDPFDKPDDDTYVPTFHKQSATYIPGLNAVDWANIEVGTTLSVSAKGTKFKHEMVEFLSQTKCQARVKVLSVGTIVRFSKTNLGVPQ